MVLVLRDEISVGRGHEVQEVCIDAGTGDPKLEDFISSYENGVAERSLDLDWRHWRAVGKCEVIALPPRSSGRV